MAKSQKIVKRVKRACLPADYRASCSDKQRAETLSKAVMALLPLVVSANIGGVMVVRGKARAWTLGAVIGPIAKNGEHKFIAVRVDENGQTLFDALRTAQRWRIAKLVHGDWQDRFLALVEAEVGKRTDRLRYEAEAHDAELRGHRRRTTNGAS